MKNPTNHHHFHLFLFHLFSLETVINVTKGNQMEVKLKVQI